MTDFGRGRLRARLRAFAPSRHRDCLEQADAWCILPRLCRHAAASLPNPPRRPPPCCWRRALRAPPTRALTYDSTSRSRTIAPEIYGHFVEHLGGVVYDGIWVGEGSKIPNVGGIRTALVDHLKRIQAPVDPLAGRLLRRQLRLARRHRRARRAAAPHELLGRQHRRCRRWPRQVRPERISARSSSSASAASPAAAVPGRQPAQPAGARLLSVGRVLQLAGRHDHAGRAARAGTASRIRSTCRYWGVGNETWGCGGNFTPEDYAAEFAASRRGCRASTSACAFIGVGPERRRPELDARASSPSSPRRAKACSAACGAGRAAPLLDLERQPRRDAATGTRARATRSASRASSGTSC